MILYRVGGRAEVWAHCGMLLLDERIVGSNKAEVLRSAQRLLQKLKKNNKSYNIYLQEIIVANPSKETWINALVKEDLDVLIQDSVILKRWTN